MRRRKKEPADAVTEAAKLPPLIARGAVNVDGVVTTVFDLDDDSLSPVAKAKNRHFHRFPLVCAALCVRDNKIAVFKYGEELAVVLSQGHESQVVLTSDMCVTSISPGGCTEGNKGIWPPKWSGEARPATYASVPIEDIFADVMEFDRVRQICVKHGIPYFAGMPQYKYKRKSRRDWLRGKRRWIFSPEIEKANEAKKRRIEVLLEDYRWPLPVKRGVFDIVHGGYSPKEAGTRHNVSAKHLSDYSRRLRKQLGETVSAASILEVETSKTLGF